MEKSASVDSQHNSYKIRHKDRKVFMQLLEIKCLILMFCSCATLDWVVDCPREPCSHTANWIPLTWEHGETTCQSFSFRVARTSSQGGHFSRQEYWSGLLFTWRRKWKPTPGFLPGETHGQRNLASYRQSMGLQEFDMTEQLKDHHAIYYHCLIYLL